MATDPLKVVRALPLTAERFADLESLFSQKGCSFARDCWCMGYRVVGDIKTSSGTAPANPKAYRKGWLKKLAKEAPSPGLIAYGANDQPLGWIAVGPRAAFPRLQNSPIMKPVTDLEAWAIVCFVVPTPHRGQWVAKALIQHAAEHARDHGAKSIEAFPHDRAGPMQPQWLWHGTLPMFEEAGFKVIARRKPNRPVVALRTA
ncbi:MAG: GNAT family N-acetyltransferase [Pseudomonadota bacterium]